MKIEQGYCQRTKKKIVVTGEEIICELEDERKWPNMPQKTKRWKIWARSEIQIFEWGKPTYVNTEKREYSNI